MPPKIHPQAQKIRTCKTAPYRFNEGGSMADQAELKTFQLLSEVIGPAAALCLCAFFASRNVYVPASIPDGHVIVNLIGREAADRLAAEYGGESLSVPACELRYLRRAGQIYALRRYGLPHSAVAAAIGVTPMRVSQIRAQLSREGYDSLLSNIQETPDHAA
jgi:hypothetical protein